MGGSRPAHRKADKSPRRAKRVREASARASVRLCVRAMSAPAAPAQVVNAYGNIGAMNNNFAAPAVASSAAVLGWDTDDDEW